MQPFDVGVQLYAASDGRAWRDLVSQAADLGYTSVHLPDHAGGQFGPFVALATAAVISNDLRIGTLVLNTALRNPLVVAKELATLDVVSEGRLEVGVGAGWQHVDFTRTGVPLLTGSARVRRLEEYVDVLEAFWRGEAFSFRGEHYNLVDVVCAPRPVQPRLPLLIGGGSKAVLDLAGRRALIAGLDVPQPAGRFSPDAFVAAASEAAFRERASWAQSAAASAGRSIRLQMSVPDDLVHLDITDSELADVARRWLVSPAKLADTPLALVGDIDALEQRLLDWRQETGVSYVVVQQGAMTRAAPLVDRLRRETPTRTPSR